MYELIPPEGIISHEGKRCFIFNKNLTKLKEEACQKYTPSAKKDISEKSD